MTDVTDPVDDNTQEASIAPLSTGEKGTGGDDTPIDGTTSDPPKRKPHRQQKGVEPSCRSLRLGRQLDVTHVSCWPIHLDRYSYVDLHSINAWHILKVVFLPKRLSQLWEDPVQVLNQRKSPVPLVILNGLLIVMLLHVHTVDFWLSRTCLLQTYIFCTYMSHRPRRKYGNSIWDTCYWQCH